MIYKLHTAHLKSVTGLVVHSGAAKITKTRSKEKLFRLKPLKSF
jgi:hypothetical protein